MAQRTYRANLSSAVFPMTIAKAGRTVINPLDDQNFDRRVDPTGSQSDVGIPQAMYLEDVIPTANGYQSVGQKTAGDLPGRNIPGPGFPYIFANFEFFFPNSVILQVLFRAASGYTDIIASDFGSDPIAWTYGTGAAISDPSPFTPAGVSRAYVRGTNYIFDGIKLYTATHAGANVVNITDISGSVTGITLNQIVAICSSANYLIALGGNNVIYWSSLTTPTDFLSSLVSGAGSITPGDLKSQGNFLSEAENGFYIYTNSGVVYAQYTGNARYPWKFNGVDDAGGYQYPTQVVSDRLKTLQYAIDNTSKLKMIQPNRAELIAPEVTTYFERSSSVDNFDPGTNLFSLGTFTRPNKIYFYLDRYILCQVASYYLIYDVLLRRYGRIKINGLPVQRQTYGVTELVFLGNPQIRLTFDIYNTNYTFNGVFVLGKIQFVRTRLLQIEQVEIEGMQDMSLVFPRDFSLVLVPSLDGRTLNSPVPLTIRQNFADGALYNCHAVGINHTLICKGAFDLATIQIRYQIKGER